MSHFTLRFAIALLTFIIGTVCVSVGDVQRQSSTKQIENIAQQPVKAADNSGIESDKDCDPSFKGRYSNYDYAYSVQIPKG